MKRAFITGATGFVGQYILDACLKEGMHCRILLHSAKLSKIYQNTPHVEGIYGDLTQPQTLKDIGQNVDYVFHCAAAGHVSAISEDAYRHFHEVNVLGTKAFIKAFQHKNIKKFIHFSSTAAMGLIRKKLVNEDDPPQPRTPYQKSKLESETVARELCQHLNIPCLILRPCMIYGIGGKGEFHKFSRLFCKGAFPKVGFGKNLTPLVHVKDVVQGAIKAARSGQVSGIYLIASDRSIPLDLMRDYILDGWGGKSTFYPYLPVWGAYSVAWLMECWARITHKAPFVTRQNIASTVWDREFSIDKAQRDLGYRPEISFKEGIRETVQWYQQLQETT